VIHPQKASDRNSLPPEIVLNLHRELVVTSDLKDFPERITKPLREVIKLDELCIFYSGAHDSSPTLISERDIPFHWDKVHPHITAEDMHSSILYRGQPGDIFLSQDMKGPGCEGDEYALGSISQFSGLKFSMHLVLSVMSGFRLHLSLFRRRKPFDLNEAETLKLFSPALIINASALLAVRLSTSGDLLLSASEEKAAFHCLMLDSKLKVIGLLKPTRDFLAENFHDPIIEGLPATLRKWLEGCELIGNKSDQILTCQTSFISESVPIECRVTPLEDSSGKTMFLAALNILNVAGGFTPLLALGLSKREIQVLECLYSGKSNAQIGEALGIKNITVRKHLLNIGGKLGAFNRTEILAKALEISSDIPARQTHSNATPPMTVLLSDRHIHASSWLKDKWRETVFNLHTGLVAIKDFDDAPDLFRDILGKFLNIDWVAIYWVSAVNGIERIFVSSGLHFDWEKLYPAIRKNISWLPVLRAMELGEVFLSPPEPQNEDDILAQNIVEAATGTHYALTMPVAKTENQSVYIQFCRNDQQRPYTRKGVALIQRLSPLIISWAQSLIRLKESSIHQMGSRSLLENAHIRAVLLDRHLCDVMWTEDALSMLNSQVGPSWRNLLFPSIREWLRQTNLLENLRKNKSRIYPEHLIIDSYNLSCCAYPLEGYILVNFKHHSSELSPLLKKYGLTTRESQVLTNLPLGYSNQQIASVLGISEVTVKKHMEKISKKLGVSGRTNILRQAEELRLSLKE
jgi:DNA-binding NarL/FixJ family response regulator